MAVRIITDSTVDMAPRLAGAVTTVPVTLRFGEEEFIDGVTMSREDFYARLAASEVLPTTSQATPEGFGRAFAAVRAAGDSAVVITLSSKLSGTYQSACIAAEDYPDIYVVDSHNATIGSGVLAEYALDCVRAGMSAGEVAAALVRRRDDIRLVAVLDTLEYLKRGGRISKAAAFAGGLLQIKPVVSITDGAVSVEGKARGVKQGSQILTDMIQGEGGVDFTMPVLFGYAGDSDRLLRRFLTDSEEVWRDHLPQRDAALVCGVIGTHVGPGAFAAAFFRAHQEQ